MHLIIKYIRNIDDIDLDLCLIIFYTPKSDIEYVNDT